VLKITEIASFLPKKRVSNYDKTDKYGISVEFIEDRIGIKNLSVKNQDHKSSDLCVRAYDSLLQKTSSKITKNIDCCIVVTQNPDYNIPHVSAIVQKKLGLSDECACFDISLGCSGYVYGLSIIFSFMNSNNLSNGLLFTSDPYSEIVDNNDKGTSLLFGDGATVTYISNKGSFIPKAFNFGTNGNMYRDLICNNKLHMNGRSVFNFVITNIPSSVFKLLDSLNIPREQVDKYIFHQGSKYIVESITKKLKIDKNKVPFDISNYGNTISSSIPFILEKEMHNKHNNIILLSGFGVGLSLANTILKRIN